MAIDDRMTAAALARAKLHIYNICSTGQDVILIKPGTGSGGKDEFGEMLTEPVGAVLTLKAYPVRFSPYDRQTTLKIAWAEDTDIMCYVSTLDLDNRAITIEMLKSYIQLRFNNKTYEMKYVDNYSAFGTDFLYAAIGAKI